MAFFSSPITRFDKVWMSDGFQNFLAIELPLPHLERHVIAEHDSHVHVADMLPCGDSVRVYAKEIKEFTSERELSEEEKKAIARARGGL